jgi:hypothetical protein
MIVASINEGSFPTTTVPNKEQNYENRTPDDPKGRGEDREEMGQSSS